MTFIIVTDSASDIEPEFKEKEDIRVVPTIVLFGKKEYRDNEISREDFLNRLISGEIATTSQPSPHDFESVYTQAVKDSENKQVLGVHISSKLSGTFQTGFAVVSNMEEGTIQMFDTQNVSLGSGYFVYLAAHLRSKGYSMLETIEILAKARDMVKIEIYIERTDYLHRSGRINLSQYWLMKYLRLKPILKCENGLLIRSGLVFGRNAAIKKIVKKIKSHAVSSNPVVIYGHATTPEIMDILKSATQDLNPSLTVDITICNTLLCHTGVGPFGIGIAPSFDYFTNK